MANLTITITNSIRCFGPAPSDKWNAYNWNAFKYGEGTVDLAVNVGKFLSNSITTDNALTIVTNINKVITNTIAMTSENASEGLKDSDGFSYVFVSNTTNGESRSFSTWASGTANAPTWASGTAGSTTWS